MQCHRSIHHVGWNKMVACCNYYDGLTQILYRIESIFEDLEYNFVMCSFLQISPKRVWFQMECKRHWLM